MDLTAVWDVARSLWVLWLIILFSAVVFWTFRPKNRKRFENDAQIPFKDEDGG